MNPERVTFLVVDDDEVSVLAIRRALSKQGLANPVVEARDGIEALNIMRNSLSPPFMLLLDINMPRMTGLELLNEIRGDPALRSTVVFILTTSDAPQDITAAYATNAAGYIVKEDAYRSIGDAVELLGLYTRVVTLPAN